MKALVRRTDDFHQTELRTEPRLDADDAGVTVSNGDWVWMTASAWDGNTHFYQLFVNPMDASVRGWIKAAYVCQERIGNRNAM